MPQSLVPLALLLMATAALAADNRDRFEARTFEQGEFRLPYRLLKPKDLDAGRKYPLVLFFHGAGERGDDNKAQLVYVTGLSMGGFGVWDTLQRRPELFAAAAPICSGGDPALAGRMKDIPVWAFHGDKDTAVKVRRSRDMIEALRAAGGQPKYTEYPGVGHDSWTRTYRDAALYEWLFAQRKP